MMKARAAADLLRKSLEGKGADVTVADAAAASGLSLADAEQGLHALVAEYRGHLRVTDDGDILFRFPHGFTKPWETKGAIVRALTKAGRALEGAARFIVRAWVAIVLVAYVAIFVAVLIALAFGRSDDRNSGRSTGLAMALFRLLGDALFWTFHPFSPFYAGEVFSGSSYRARPARSRSEGPPFYERVDRFFFGPKEPPVDEGRAYRAVLAEIRAQKGRIGLADVMRVTGQSREEIDPLMSRLLVDYGGNVEVSEEGGIAYAFPELRKSVQEKPVARPEPIWSKRETVAPITGNPPGTDLLIGALNGFNLIMSGWVLATGLTIERLVAILQKVPLRDLPPTGTSIVLGVIPFVFSIALFLLPLGRIALRARKTRKVQRENGRRAVLRAVLESVREGKGITEQELATRYRVAAGVDPDPKELTKEVVALGGDVDLDRAAEGVRYRFKDLELESKAVEAEREAASEAEAKVGPVVFSSED